LAKFEKFVEAYEKQTDKLDHNLTEATEKYTKLQEKKLDQDEQKKLKQALEAKEREYANQQKMYNDIQQENENLKKGVATAKKAYDDWMAANNNTEDPSNAQFETIKAVYDAAVVA
jgi:chromosome segregation ATPase